MIKARTNRIIDVSEYASLRDFERRLVDYFHRVIAIGANAAGRRTTPFARATTSRRLGRDTWKERVPFSFVLYDIAPGVCGRKGISRDL